LLKILILNVVHSKTDSCHSQGVCIIISKHIPHKIINYTKDEEGRFLLINVEIFDQIFTLVNIYAPNKTRREVI
jgi:hypothetical protein